MHVCMYVCILHTYAYKRVYKRESERARTHSKKKEACGGVWVRACGQVGTATQRLPR
jgi:hypothetical protein